MVAVINIEFGARHCGHGNRLPFLEVEDWPCSRRLDHEFVGCKPNLELDSWPINNLAHDGDLKRAVHVLALDRQIDLRARLPPYLAVKLAGSEALGWHAVHVGNNVAHAHAGLGGGRAIEHPGEASPAIFRFEL